MAIIITLNAVDRTNSVDLKTLSIQDTISANADTCDFDISVSSTEGWRPQAGNPLVITNGTGKEFGGVVEEINEELKSPTALRYHVAGRDYTYFFDKYLVVDESTGTLTASAWVSRIISGFTTGFTAVNVMAGPTIAARQFNYVSPSEAIRSIADEIGYGWYIDYDKDVHFFPAATMTAPVPTLDAEADTTNYGILRFRETVSAVKDRVYMKDYKHKTSSQWNRSFTGDGNTRFFLLGNEPASIGSADMTATVNGVALDLLTDFIDGKPGTATGSSSQLFICFDNEGARTSTGATAFTSTQTLSVTFNVMEEAITQVEDLAAQATLAAREGGDGVHEYVIANAQMSASDGSDDLAYLQGSIALARYAFPRVTGSFESFTQGWRAGQQFVITSTRRLGGFTDTFLVQTCTKNIVNHPSGGTPVFRTVVEFADGIVGI